MKKLLQTALLASLALSATATLAQGRDYITIVGSSTVYPFTTVVAERFGRGTSYPTPKVESTGSGGGLKLFCQGVGTSHPDATNASRRIKASEVAMCEKNGVTEIVEMLIGYDGIVIANSREAAQYELSLKDVYLALAKQVPNPNGSETLVANPYKTWKDVNPDLPDTAIEVMGPPPTSGTRDAFVELAMEGGCKSFGWIADIKASDKDRYKAICHSIREDGPYVEAGENDNLIVQKLEANPQALGIFGYSFLDQNSDLVQASVINGKVPTIDSIADGSYPISRAMYVYVKKAHVGVIPGLKEFLAEYTSERAWGDGGYLAEKGLIPLSASERRKAAQAVRELKPLKL